KCILHGTTERSKIFSFIAKGSRVKRTQTTGKRRASPVVSIHQEGVMVMDTIVLRSIFLIQYENAAHHWSGSSTGRRGEDDGRSHRHMHDRAAVSACPRPGHTTCRSVAGWF